MLDVASQTIEFVVWGRPVPRGSTKAFVNKKTGRAMVTDQRSGPLNSWMQDVRTVAINNFALVRNDLIRGPVKVDIAFRLNRPKSHFGTGRNVELLKDSAPRFPIVTPDLDKLTRAVNDALTKTIIWDDSQIVQLEVKKVYGVPEGAKIRIQEL